MDYLRRNGIPHSVAGDVFVAFFERLTGNFKSIVHVSYYLDKKFHGISNISLSLPFVACKGKIVGISPINLNSVEEQRFRNVALQLKRSINHILTASKKLVAYK